MNTGAIILGTLLVTASAPILAILFSDRNPSDTEAFDGYDDIDKMWLQNTIIMPELAPVPKSIRPKVINSTVIHDTLIFPAIEG